MTSGDEVVVLARKLSRSAGPKAFDGSTDDFLTRYALESFLERLSRTDHARSFVLKGGLAVSVYSVRRPTKDIDSALIDEDLDVESLTSIVNDVVAVAIDDGMDIDLTRLDIQEIREGTTYPGVRVRLKAKIGTARVGLAWDVSTGDPITPDPRLLTIPRVLGGEISMLGYTPESIVAEKAVTILERGVTSTRLRDFVDIVELAAHNELDDGDLRAAIRAVASHRGVELQPTAAVVVGYGAIGQAKWAAWRRKHGLENICEAELDDQMVHVARVVDATMSAD